MLSLIGLGVSVIKDHRTSVSDWGCLLSKIMGPLYITGCTCYQRSCYLCIGLGVSVIKDRGTSVSDWGSLLSKIMVSMPSYCSLVNGLFMGL